MQTFLPYASFYKTGCCLDLRRLNKQITEGGQIENALVDPNYGWQNHPAVRMWRGHLDALRLYNAVLTAMALRRGLNMRVASARYFPDGNTTILDATVEMPRWLGDVAFHNSHRSNLLRKNPNWYTAFQWDVSDALPYIWPLP